MSKNSSAAASISDTQREMIYDDVFKDLGRYKCIAAILIKAAVPEFKNMNYIEIAEHIIDKEDRKYNGDYDRMMNDEIDTGKTELGTGDEKKIIYDLVFDIRLPSGEEAVATINSRASVDLEIQKRNEHNTVQRAIYYGASLLRDTVRSGDKKYGSIHKVYSAWFCNFNLGLDLPLTTPSGKHIDRKININQYIHRYGIRRFYDDITDYSVIDQSADLIAVTLIDLKALESKVSKTSF